MTNVLKKNISVRTNFYQSYFSPIKIEEKVISLYHRGLLPVYIFVYYHRGTR